MTPAHRTEAVLTEDGKLSLKDLPFRAGQAVEVLVLPATHTERNLRSPSPAGAWSQLITDLKSIGDSVSETARTWPELFADLRSARMLEDDWDGQGARAPNSELVDAATAWVEDLQAAGSTPPDFAVAGVNGTVFFEWHAPGGFLEIEVTGPDEAEGRLVRKGSQVTVAYPLSRRL